MGLWLWGTPLSTSPPPDTRWRWGGDRFPSGHRRLDRGSRAPHKCSAWAWLRVQRGWLLAPVPGLTSGTEPCPPCGPGPEREAAWPDLPSSAPAPRARGQACCVAAGCGRWLGPQGAHVWQLSSEWAEQGLQKGFIFK